jgi:hypothetical protein
MGLRNVTGTDCGGRPVAVWICSTSGWALGPVFASIEQADDFESYVWRTVQCDPRKVDTRQLHELWRAYLEVKRGVVAGLLTEQS